MTFASLLNVRPAFRAKGLRRTLQHANFTSVFDVRPFTSALNVRISFCTKRCPSALPPALRKKRTWREKRERERGEREKRERERREREERDDVKMRGCKMHRCWQRRCIPHLISQKIPLLRCSREKPILRVAPNTPNVRGWSNGQLEGTLWMWMYRYIYIHIYIYERAYGAYF